MNPAEKLKDTLNLPQTDFPMRANAVEREPVRIDHWKNSDVYARMQDKNKGGESFVLHDGPPFTNGDVHVGTALNKVLKDSILRFKSARGFRTPYVPGWDCHGLPIEHKVTKALRKEKKDFDSLILRQACKDFSNAYIETQRKQFQRLGVLADWGSEYRTMNGPYEAEILKTFASFVEKGLVYRSKKPVYWSIPCRTALAEAEIEYQNHVSPSIFVRFPLMGKAPNSFIVIWTTTPWTLPANLAIAVHPREKYVELKVGENRYWVAESLSESVGSACSLEGMSIGDSLLGEDMIGWVARHPFIERDSPVLAAEYVTMESGTGCVHTAPGHGLDDYLTGQVNGLETYCPLDDNGCYVDDGQIPERLVGVSVLEKASGCAANNAVLDILEDSGDLLALTDHNHQYPHCWRSKTPVVFRAMDQWFVSLDHDDLRIKSLEEVEGVRFTPDWGKNRIKGFLEARPDWCISRQRSWGVPIPVFYDEDGEPLLDASLIRLIAEKVEQANTDVWFDLSTDELIDGFDLPEKWKGKKLAKGMDTLDVWIDSGCSHRAVLRGHDELEWPADLYLEGSDQHRGWFQSSLWTSMVAYQKAPYRHILTHGFVVDGDGRKISKSDGKPQTADSYVTKYGADVLRLWVCSEDFRRDIPLSDEILGQVVRAYRTLRNTIRFQLGTLFDFSVSNDAVELNSMSSIDLWALSQTNIMIEEVSDAFERFEIHRAVQIINRFCSGPLSSTYHDVIKDRLYTLHSDAPARRSTQTAIHLIFDALVRVIGPLTPFTADEAWSFRSSGKELCSDALVLQNWPQAYDLTGHMEAVSDINALLEFKESKVNEALEGLRANKEIGQSLDAQVKITLSPENPLWGVFKRRGNDLAETFIVSSVVLVEEADLNLSEINVSACHAPGVRCPRSWRWVPELVEVERWGKVSPRCAEVLAKLA
ncbi:MAG: isoleucine--tRNA ligase [Opitutae bacterium]|nr:isoleucine--tRNA ligase [Opitutae bacterium]|tara:strand:+ start:3248 stop:6043 length:2796 start_codon:yes stop_codon:yes gene_type:complete